MTLNNDHTKTSTKFYFNIIDGVYNENNDTDIVNDYNDDSVNHNEINNENENNNEHNNIEKEYISFQDAKKIYGFDIDKPLDWNTFYSRLHEKYPHFKFSYIKQLYFHYILVIGNYININIWLIEYINTHSIQQLETILNTPISVPVYFNCKKHIYYLYPIATYSMWNINPNVIRLLISFGANVYTCDKFGYYPEESIQHIHYFHPIPCLKPILFKEIQKENFNININENLTNIFYRNVNEFIDIINEIKYVAGEDISHNWIYPI